MSKNIDINKYEVNIKNLNDIINQQEKKIKQLELRVDELIQINNGLSNKIQNTTSISHTNDEIYYAYTLADNACPQIVFEDDETKKCVEIKSDYIVYNDYKNNIINNTTSPVLNQNQQPEDLKVIHIQNKECFDLITKQYDKKCLTFDPKTQKDVANNSIYSCYLNNRTQVIIVNDMIKNKK